jgi:hypothetical protein
MNLDGFALGWLEAGALRADRASRGVRALALSVLLVLAGPLGATAQDAGGSLAAEARDPTASLLAVQLRYDLVADFHQVHGETLGTFMVQPVIPFKTGPVAHVARITLPIITHSPSLRFRPDDILPGLPSTDIRAGGASGLADIALLDVLIFGVPGGRLGAGPVMTVPSATSSDLGSKKWTLGPAAVAMLKADDFQYGGLLQGFFSFAGDRDRDDVRKISLQPFLNYALPEDWSIGFSEMAFVYDFEQSRWGSLPLGLNVDKLVQFGSLPVRLAVQTEYNFKSAHIAPAWTVRFIVTPLFPL